MSASLPPFPVRPTVEGAAAAVDPTVLAWRAGHVVRSAFRESRWCPYCLEPIGQTTTACPHCNARLDANA